MRKPCNMPNSEMEEYDILFQKEDQERYVEKMFAAAGIRGMPEE